MDKKLVDLQEKPFKKVEVVRMLEIPQDLFSKLPESKHVALKAEIGNVHLIQSLDEYGKIELEFHDEDYMPHTIWISPSCVTRTLEYLSNVGMSISLIVSMTGRLRLIS